MCGVSAGWTLSLLMAALLSSPSAHSEATPDWLLAPTQLSGMTPLEVGDMAPTFDLPDAEGVVHSLAEWRGQVVVLVFWASWCPHCRRLWPQIQTLMDFHSGAPVTILGLNVWDEAEAAKAYRSQHGLRFSILFADEALAQRYAVVSTPTTLVLDRDGRVAARIQGADPDDDRLDRAVTQSLQALP